MSLGFRRRNSRGERHILTSRRTTHKLSRRKKLLGPQRIGRVDARCASSAPGKTSRADKRGVRLSAELRAFTLDPVGDLRQQGADGVKIGRLREVGVEAGGANALPTSLTSYPITWIGIIWLTRDEPAAAAISIE